MISISAPSKRFISLYQHYALATTTRKANTSQNHHPITTNCIQNKVILYNMKEPTRRSINIQARLARIDEF